MDASRGGRGEGASSGRTIGASCLELWWCGGDVGEGGKVGVVVVVERGVEKMGWDESMDRWNAEDAERDREREVG